MMFWLIHISIIGLLSYIAFKYLKSSFNPFVYWSAFALKLVSGIGLGLIFHYYYESGDTLILFEKAAELSKLGSSKYFDELLADGSYATNNHPRDLFFIKILSVFSLLTGNSYWITSLYLSFIGFISSWYFVISISRLFPSISIVAIISFLFIPSIVFWSSGILKDTLSLAALTCLITISLKGIHLKKGSFLAIILGLIASIVLYKIKHYLFISFILFAALLIGFQLIKMLKSKLKWIYAFVILIVSLGSTQFIHPYLKWDRLPQTIYENNLIIQGNSSASSELVVIVENPSWSAVVKAVPEALFTGLFRPSIFDKTIYFGWIHRFENLILTMLTVLSILIWAKKKPDIDLTLLIASIGCICLLATMLALTTPNFGSLVRYRNAFLPFLFLIVSVLPFQYFASQGEE